MAFRIIHIIGTFGRESVVQVNGAIIQCWLFYWGISFGILQHCLVQINKVGPAGIETGFLVF